MKHSGSDPLVTALFLALFTSGGVLYTLGSAVGSALFISSLPQDQVPRIVPWVYVGAAVASVITALLYDRLLARMSRMAALLITQTSLAAFFSGSMWLWVREQPSHYYVLTVGLDAASLLSLTLFFGFAADYFSAREARRIYGLIAGGLALGTVVGGEGLSYLLQLVSVPNLVHVCAGVLALNALMCLAIGRMGVPVPSPSGETQHDEPDVSLRVLVSSPYVRLVWLTFIVGMVLTVASAFQMQWIASEKPRAELAAFFGRFYAWVGAAQLAFQFLLVPFILRSFGVLGALMLPPFLVGAASGVMQSASAASYFGGTQLGYSAAVNGVRLTLEETLSFPARELLFLPLPARVRSRAQTLAGALLAPLTRGIAGVLLMGYVGWGFGIDHLSYVVMGCALVLLLTFVRMRAPYRQALLESLRASSLGGTDLTRLLDAQGADAVLRDLLKSSDEGVVRFTLDLVGERAMPSLVSVVKPLALHHTTEIASRAVHFLGAQGDASALPVIELSLESPRPEVVAAAILALAQLKGLAARTRILPFLHADSALVVEASLVALARQLHADDDVIPHVTAWLASAEREDRARGIRLAARVARPRYGELLMALLESEDAQERRAAALAAATCGARATLPLLITRLKQGELPASACAFLGSDGLGALSQALSDPVPPAERRLLLRGVAEVPHSDALTLLLRELDSDLDVLTRATAAECLRRVAQHESPSIAVRVHLDTLIERECNACDRLFEACGLLGARDEDIHELLFEHAALRLELVLGLCGLYVLGDEYTRMRGSLSSRSQVLRGSALELLDASLPRKLANRVGPSLNASFAERTVRAEGRELGHALLAEIAALGSFTSAIVARYVERRGGDAARFLGNPDASTAFERLSEVVFLNRVPLFTALPTDYLYEIAQVAESVTLLPGTKLFARGDRGDALYMVCEGTVSIEVDGRKVALLSPGEPLGELALLDGDARSASAVASSPARLLKLSVERFDTLLSSEPALRSALMRTLYVRLQGQRMSIASSRGGHLMSMAPRRHALGLGELVSVLGILREVELFHGLPQDTLMQIATCAHPSGHFAGETIYEAGQPGDAFYIVCTGEVSVTTSGLPPVLLTRGACFGEGALASREPRDHGTRMVSDGQLVRFSASELNQLFDSAPNVGIAMLRHFATRLRAETEQRVAQ